MSRECVGPMRCRACKGENHKASDPQCPANKTESDDMENSRILKQSTPLSGRNRSHSVTRNNTRRIDNMLQKVREDVSKKVVHSPPTPPETEGKKQKRDHRDVTT